MRKKRSGIKSEVSPSSVATKPTNGFREAKRGGVLADAQPRLNSSHGFQWVSIKACLWTIMTFTFVIQPLLKIIHLNNSLEREKAVERSYQENGSAKIGRTTSGNIKGERRTKTKPKQRSSSEMAKSESVEEDDKFLEDPIDLSQLQLAGFDVFGGWDDLEGQVWDISSWLNIDDELPDHDDELPDHDDFNGLQIPMG